MEVTNFCLQWNLFITVIYNTPVPCRYNAVDLLQNPHKRHHIARMLGVSFVAWNSDSYSASVSAVMMTVLCYIIMAFHCISHIYTYSLPITNGAYISDCELTKDTPYVALMVESWSVFCDFFGENVLHEGMAVSI